MRYKFKDEIYEILFTELHMNTFSEHGSTHDMTYVNTPIKPRLYSIHIEEIQSRYAGRVVLCLCRASSEFRLIPVFEVQLFEPLEEVIENAN